MWLIVDSLGMPASSPLRKVAIVWEYEATFQALSSQLQMAGQGRALLLHELCEDVTLP